MKRAVFLDRDGVLNRSILIEGVPTPPVGIGDVEIIDGVVEAIQILIDHEFVPVVITNQPDVARGNATRSEIEAINAHVGAATSVKHFYTCFHDDTDLCGCRKPLPGLIHQAAHDLNLSIRESSMVGDRWRDIGAGNAAGCKSFFIDYSYTEKGPDLPYTRVYSLLEAVLILTGEPIAAK
jgi:D-glycero-D-manno-heptose 1,7-bisphosphate phosphatase